MALSEAAKAAKRAYTNQYYATHKEQRKASQEAYWERKALEMMKGEKKDEQIQSVKA